MTLSQIPMFCSNITRRIVKAKSIVYGKEDIERISRGEDGQLFTRTDNTKGYRPDDVKIEKLAPVNTTGPEMIDRIPTNVDNLYYEGTNISKPNNQNNQNNQNNEGLAPFQVQQNTTSGGGGTGY